MTTDDTQIAAQVALDHPDWDEDTVMLHAQQVATTTLRLLTTTEAAACLGVNRQWVWRLIQAGRLPATKHGRDWLIKAADLERLERRVYRRSAADAGAGTG